MRSIIANSRKFASKSYKPPALPNIPHIKTDLPGPNAKQIISRDHDFLSSAMTRPYPLVIKRGQGAMLEDVDGNIFLDFNAGVAVCAAGHAHEEIVEAVKNQVDDFMHICSSDFYFSKLPELAEKLSRLTPGNYTKRIHFGNSGAEGNEAALKLAMYHTRRSKFIGFFGSFHGRTMGALSLTASKPRQRAGFGAQALDASHIPYANCYRCPYFLTPETCGAKEEKGPHCARVIEDVLMQTTCPPEEVAAIVVEPIQGEGGYVVPPKSFLQTIRKIADKYDILVIADEVQSGFGRTGKFFASEHADFVPDILTAAKGIASGLPLSATIASKEIMSWPPGAHGSTFGGNPVAIAASLATIKLIENGLLENAAVVGDKLMKGVQELMKKYEFIGDVRGRGLMIGIELVKSRNTKEPAADARNTFEYECFRRGLITLGCGTSTLRLSPSLIITEEQVHIALRILDDALKATREQHKL